MSDTKELATATFANGCFWCTEAVFKRVKGVESVMPGYSGGTMENPTYYDVAMKNTGHAESLQLRYDPKVILPMINFSIYSGQHMTRQH